MELNKEKYGHWVTSELNHLDKYPYLKELGFEYLVGSSFPFDFRGVYLLFDGSELVYIGATTMRRRIAGHKSGLNKKIFTDVYFLSIEDCWDVEIFLINLFKPKYNKQIYWRKSLDVTAKILNYN